MRPLEALLVGALIILLVLRWIKPRNRQFTSSAMVMLGIFAALHLAFDRPRWEMIPAYLMGVVSVFIMLRDLRRVSGTKAGESARWARIPSMGERIASGVLLGMTAAAAVAIPAWAFPRIVFPEPDGLYDVGRVDVTWVDSSRTMPAGGPRPLVLSAWYPAEAPAGRALPYHPNPGVLGAALASKASLPGFTFRNLTAARTAATRSPRFSIREGRSPVVIASPDVAASRMESTALFQRLASNGYVVISIDHAGSAIGAVGPDGVALPVIPGDAGSEIATRVADMRFVIDRLNALPGGRDAVDSLTGHVRLDRIAVVGVGVGGAAVAEAAVVEPRVSAVASVVPASFGQAAQRGVRRPFLILTVGEPPDGFASVVRYGATEVRLDGATPESVRDVALLGAPVVQRLGITSVDAPRDVHAAVSALVLRFLDQYLKERREQTEVDLPQRVQLHVIPHQAR